MEKTFTVNVPDQLWVDSWTNEDTIEYTYNGPDNLHIVVKTTGDFEIIEWAETAPTRLIDAETEQVLELDADTHTSVAHLLVAGWVADYTYTYTTITNHDDSEYEEMSNPQLPDMFEAKYNITDGFHLSPIYKKVDTVCEITARERLAYVVKYDDAYDFDADTQAVIDTFKSAMSTYLTAMATVYPWRYVTIDTAEIPRVPASLVAAFTDLPALD